jgi:hypothetical protein
LRRSCGQTGGAHFVHEFPRSSRVEIAAEELTVFGWFRIELLDKTADVVAVARQLRLEVVQLTGEDMEPAADQDAVPKILYANFGCFALLTAHKLQIFKLFETEALTTAEAASRLSIPNRPMEILLTTLAAHRLLSNSGGRFALEALARNYLLESSPTYLGGMLDFTVATHSMCTVENLEHCVRSDRSLAYGRGEIFQEHAEQVTRARVFTRAMHSQSIAPAMAWPKRLDLSNHKMMLDIAGGSGAHAIGALQNWPNLKATV